MRRLFLLSTVALLVITAAVGCSKKQSGTEAGGTTSDSLLASNPIEPPAGDITPQTDMTQKPPAEQAAPPAATPRPQASTPKPRAQSSSTAPARDPGVTVASGTPLNISVATQISSETANVGDAWSGEIKENVIVGNIVVFPAGSVVSGTVSSVTPAKKGSRALLGLDVRSITVNGNSHGVDATMEPIEAGSTRARNLGVVAGGAAAGALVGRAVGGSGKGALIGGLIGGAGAAAGAAASKGYQVVVKEGTVLTFNVKESVKVRP